MIFVLIRIYAKNLIVSKLTHPRLPLFKKRGTIRCQTNQGE